jgi:hypothetical protein
VPEKPDAWAQTINEYFRRNPEEVVHKSLYGLEETTDTHFLGRHPHGYKHLTRKGCCLGWGVKVGAFITLRYYCRVAEI